MNEYITPYSQENNDPNNALENLNRRQENVDFGSLQNFSSAFSDSLLNDSWFHDIFNGVFVGSQRYMGPIISKQEFDKKYKRPGIDYAPEMHAQYAHMLAYDYDQKQKAKSYLQYINNNNAHNTAQVVGRIAAMLADPIPWLLGGYIGEMASWITKSIEIAKTASVGSKIVRSIPRYSTEALSFSTIGAGLSEFNAEVHNQHLTPNEIMSSIGKGALYGTALPVLVHTGIGGVKLAKSLLKGDQEDIQKIAGAQYASDQNVDIENIYRAKLYKNLTYLKEQLDKWRNTRAKKNVKIKRTKYKNKYRLVIDEDEETPRTRIVLKEPSKKNPKFKILLKKLSLEPKKTKSMFDAFKSKKPRVRTEQNFDEAGQPLLNFKSEEQQNEQVGLNAENINNKKAKLTFVANKGHTTEIELPEDKVLQVSTFLHDNGIIHEVRMNDEMAPEINEIPEELVHFPELVDNLPDYEKSAILQKFLDDLSNMETHEEMTRYFEAHKPIIDRIPFDSTIEGIESFKIKPRKIMKAINKKIHFPSEDEVPPEDADLDHMNDEDVTRSPENFQYADMENYLESEEFEKLDAPEEEKQVYKRIMKEELNHDRIYNIAMAEKDKLVSCILENAYG